MENPENIELRSENVRKVIGQALPFPIRVGILMVAIVVTLLLAVAFFLPLPDTSKGMHPENKGKTFYERISSNADKTEIKM